MCSKHDRAYRRWMPHINLLYPFIIDDPTGKSFSMAADKLTPVLAIVPSFQIRFDAESFRFFRHGKNCTLWLKPQANTSCVLGEISYLVYSFQSIQNFEICGQGNICMSHWGWTLLSDRVKNNHFCFYPKFLLWPPLQRSWQPQSTSLLTPSVSWSGQLEPMIKSFIHYIRFI